MNRKLRPVMAAVVFMPLAAGAIQSSVVRGVRPAPTSLIKGDESLDYLINKASQILQLTIHSPYDTILGYDTSAISKDCGSWRGGPAPQCSGL